MSSKVNTFNSINGHSFGGNYNNGQTNTSTNNNNNTLWTAAEGGVSVNAPNQGWATADLFAGDLWSGSANASAQVWGAKLDGQATGLWGLAHAGYSSDTSVLGADAYAKGSLEFGDGKLIGADFGAGASAYLFSTENSASAGIKYIGEVGAQGNAFIGASAEANADKSIGKDGVYAEVGGSAFVGASANVSGSVKTNIGINAEAGVGVAVGFGAEGKVKAGFKDGRLDFKCSFGLALGVGIRFNLGFSIDFKKAWNTIKGGAKKAWNTFKSGCKTVASGIGNAVKTVGKGIKKAGEAVVSVAKKVGNTVKSAAKKVGKFFKKLFW
jgi:hypothetical protein